MDIQNNTLVRYGLLEMLEQEFGVQIGEDELENIELAKQCISTRWAKDNPEFSDFQYLLENNICKWIEGKVWYFSRIQFEEQLKKLDK